VSPHLRRGRYRPRFLSVAFLAPIGRLAEVPTWGKVASAAAAFAAAVLGDVFTPLLGLLVASALVDYFFGRKAAHRNTSFDSDVARAGAYSKAGGILQLLLIRCMEAFLTGAHVLDTKGMVAVALGVGLFVVDVESVERHRRNLGGRPIPGLAQVLALLRAIPRRLLGAPPPAPRRRRAAR